LIASAGGKVIPWKRDDTDMYQLHIDVPEGVDKLSISYDYLGSPIQDGFSTGASATANLAVLNWNMLVLYPRGASPRDLIVRPSIELPPAWKFATSLAPSGREGDRVAFAPVPLETLIDSPVQVGIHLSEIKLGELHG